MRKFLCRFLIFCLIFLLCLFSGSAIATCWLFIRAEVKQSIEIGFMKNLMIRTQTLTQIKMNEIEDIGTDLSQVAHIISDLVSYPDTHADEEYLQQVSKTNMHHGKELSNHGTQSCDAADGVSYSIFFTGTVL